jgi:hypothetical protein
MTPIVPDQRYMILPFLVDYRYVGGDPVLSTPEANRLPYDAALGLPAAGIEENIATSYHTPPMSPSPSSRRSDGGTWPQPRSTLPRSSNSIFQ